MRKFLSLLFFLFLFPVQAGAQSYSFNRITQGQINVVTNCGVPTDGVTDATSAFQTCLTNNPGAHIFVPKVQPYNSTDYNFTSVTNGCTLTMQGNGQWIDGESTGYINGVQLQFAAGATGICAYNSGPGNNACQGCHVSNLALYGNEQWDTTTASRQILPLGLNGVATSGSAATITAISDAAGTVSVTTSAAHGLIVGQDVTITGTTNYNSTYQVLTVPTTTSFTVATETSTAYGSEASGTAQGLITTSSSTSDGIRACADFFRFDHLYVQAFGRHGVNMDSAACGREVGFTCSIGSNCLADEGDMQNTVIQRNRGDGIYGVGGDFNSNSFYNTTLNRNQNWAIHDAGFLGNKVFDTSGQLNHVDQMSTPATVNISSITGTSGVVSVTLASPLILVVGEAVVIAGTTNYNGTFFVATVTDTTHFTFGLAGTIATETTGTTRLAKATEVWTAAGIDGGHYKAVGASQAGVYVAPYAETGQPLSKFAGNNAIFGGNLSSGGIDFSNSSASEYTARFWKGSNYTFQRPTDNLIQVILQSGATAYSGAAISFTNQATTNVWKINGATTTLWQIEDSANSAFPFISYNAGFLGLNSRGGNALRLQNATGATGSVLFQNAGVTTSTIFNDGSIGTVEAPAHAGIASSDVLYADSTAHRWKMNNNNGGAFNIPGVSAAAVSGHIATYAANGLDLVDGGVVPGGLSGLTAGFLMKAASATTAANSLCDEAITTANTLTCTNTAGLKVVSVATGTSPPTCTPGTAGAICEVEGTAPTAAAAVGDLWPDSTTHTWMAHSNGGSPQMMVLTQPSPINSGDLTAAVSTATLCASAAGACNQPGQYHVQFNFIETGTACGTPGTGGVTFLLTWTDANGTAHSAVSLAMDDATAITALSQTFHFQTSLAAAWASGVFNISSNGSVIQYATGYTACSVGTGTYRLQAAVTRLQ